MAHHATERSDWFEQGMPKGMGPTGKHPRGKLCEEDEGEIQIAVGGDIPSRTVIVNFGKPIESIGFSCDQAIQIAETIRDKAFELRGITVPGAN